jgi:hypothetical protein
MLRKKFSLVIVVIATILIGVTLLIFSSNLKPPAKSTIINKAEDTNYNKQILSLSIPIHTMSFENEDENWKGSYVVIKEGQSTTAWVGFFQKFFDLDQSTIKYTIETNTERTSGTVEKSDTRSYNVSVDFIPQKNEVIKLTIEYGNKKSALELNNKITDDVISPERAVEVFMSKFNVSEKEVGYILFDNTADSKEWHLLTSLGYVKINAITGKFIYIITGRDEPSDGIHLNME